MATPSSSDRYGTHAAELGLRYDSVGFEQVHDWLLPLLPDPPAAVLDVGAGSGRDAAWLSDRGYEVVAAEPSAPMRAYASHRHPARAVQWIDDRLPGLEVCHRVGTGFDLILLSAVWMHVEPHARERAFRKLVTLLKPGGLVAFTLRHESPSTDPTMHPVSLAELERLALRHGAIVTSCGRAADAFGRDGISWERVIVRLPDDGTGAMPLLRHLIVNNAKSSTYKLALLRTLCRIADGAAGTAMPLDEERVEIPFGLVGLYWLRLYRPLLEANLPQTPVNRGIDGLGFTGPGYRAMIDSVATIDLRIGARFDSRSAAPLHQALKEACDTIAGMPVRHSNHPDGRPIFEVRRAGRRIRPTDYTTDLALLWSFGSLVMPRHLWQCLTRHEVWVEPALIAEWVRLIRRYADGRGIEVDEGALARAMTWSDPRRDVGIARARALAILSTRPLRCIWSGRSLTAGNLDIDHCLPWFAWPCDALWNLMPAAARVNRDAKRDRLPSDRLLLDARDRILEWWDDAYRNPEDQGIAYRFAQEARASLPGLPIAAGELDSEDVFGALRMQRMRLQNNQQIPPWDP